MTQTKAIAPTEADALDALVDMLTAARREDGVTVGWDVLGQDEGSTVYEARL